MGVIEFMHLENILDNVLNWRILQYFCNLTIIIDGYSLMLNKIWQKLKLISIKYN